MAWRSGAACVKGQNLCFAHRAVLALDLVVGMCGVSVPGDASATHSFGLCRLGRRDAWHASVLARKVVGEMHRGRC